MIPSVYEVARRLSVRACQTQKLKAGMISLSFVMPIDRESSYLTSLLLSVLHRGTKSYPTIAALNRRLDYLFGTELSVRNYYRGDLHVFGLAADLIGEDYLPGGREASLMEDVLEVMREILFSPLLDENGLLLDRYVESEKNLQCDAIRALKNSPRAYAIEHCSATVYQNEPCGAPIYGTEEGVMAVTPKMLTEHWRRLISDLKLHCFYVGPDAPKDVCKRVEKAFACVVDVPGEPPHAEPIRTFYAPRPTERREEELPVSQGQLVIALRGAAVAGVDDTVACTVFNEILGVSPMSKLFVNVRERCGLCYHCSSYYNMYKGTILISCGLHPDNREAAEREILHQVSLLQKGEFSDDELTAAKRSLKNAYRQIRDNPTATESFYFGRALYGVNKTLAETDEMIANVTREDVLRVANALMTDTVYFLNGTATDGEEADDDAE